jgi:hypothetical protein
MGLQKTVFGRVKYKPNTFIGGVSATINTPALIAARLGIAESRIRAFNVIGSDIQFAVIGGIYSTSTNMFTNNTSITYFKDDAGLVDIVRPYTFQGCVNLIYAILPLAKTLQGNGPGGSFEGCTKLEYVSSPNITALGGYVFYGCVALKTVNYPLLTHVGYQSFVNCRALTEVYLPSCIDIIYYAFKGCSLLKIFSAPKCTNIGRLIDGQTFHSCGSLESIYLPSCKIITDGGGNENNFANIKIGCVIAVNIFLKTNNAGAPDGDLLYAKNTRNAIINFYDDAGNYVSTL